ncbi:hypothetical protein L211DRAFT_842219 [Terfezia boudieri ATCC MYA-4762]|uniref:Uncharacterized protein n=1 Tax=Terfezia boudieri ATCC MYA-4762 TaxID=1051890 RepID=A0A3N4LPM2_9PEZI|nr:hypothetical protein L211DRAFT_842219 [Terfezia boudieri ATCC MYA-4762]
MQHITIQHIQNKNSTAMAALDSRSVLVYHHVHYPEKISGSHMLHCQLRQQLLLGKLSRT